MLDKILEILETGFEGLLMGALSSAIVGLLTLRLMFDLKTAESVGHVIIIPIMLIGGFIGICICIYRNSRQNVPKKPA